MKEYKIQIRSQKNAQSCVPLSNVNKRKKISVLLAKDIPFTYVLVHLLT
jgi:hypothetical protein